MTIHGAMTGAMANDLGNHSVLSPPQRWQPHLLRFRQWLVTASLSEYARWLGGALVPQADYARTLGSADEAIRREVKGLGP